MSGWVEPTVSAIVDELEHEGRWGHVGWLSDQKLGEVRALARERGLYVRCSFWSDRPEQDFEAATPGVDSRTGLADWAALEAELERHEQAALLSIVVIDVTGLTETNRAFGKETADELVAALGRWIKRLADRTGEFVARARPHGDEFVIVLPNAREDEAHARALSIASYLHQLDLPPALRAAYRGVHWGAHTRHGPGAVPRDWLRT